MGMSLLSWSNFAFHAQEQANLTNANLEGALVTGNTSFKGAVITGAGMSQAVNILKFCLITVFQSNVSHQLPIFVSANITYSSFIFFLVGIVLKYSPTVVLARLY
jgi:uncharacterized protein YjbI with pentapeptide repeats